MQLRDCIYGIMAEKHPEAVLSPEGLLPQSLSGSKPSNSGGSRRHFSAPVVAIVFRVSSKGKMYSMKFTNVNQSVITDSNRRGYG